MLRVWFERAVPNQAIERLRGVAEILGPGTDTPDDLLAAAGDADAIIASSLITYDAKAMDRAPGLRVISRTGIGYENVDVFEATRRGIAVCNAPDAPSASTGEHAIALLLAVAKRLEASQNALRAGGRDFFGSHSGIELEGRCLGIVGAGRIGRRVAHAATALGMRVVAFDPFLNSETSDALDVEWVDTLPALCADADFLSLHIPLSDTTRGLMDAAMLQTMKPGAILVNTARGGLVDTDALLAALENGHLGGAGLDVTDPEPLPPTHPLLHRDDVVVTPHVAAATAAAKARLYETAIAQALQVLEDERPTHLVNPEVWDSAHRARELTGGDR